MSTFLQSATLQHYGGRQTNAQVKQARDAVLNLLLDAWAADNARSVKMDKFQQLGEEREACQLALQLNRPEVTMRLLNTGFQGNKNELLADAAYHAQLGLMKALVQQGASLNYTTIKGASLLDMACAGADSPGKVEVVKYLLDQGADVNHRDTSIFSPLLSAARVNPDVVKLLLSHGAKVNVQSATGDTALIVAALAGRMENVRMLLAHGANPSLKNGRGETVSSIAIRYKHPEIIRLLQQAGAKK